MNDFKTEDMANRDWLTKEEAEAFIGNNSSFYLEKWGSHYNSAFKGWNWAAMFFSVEWMAYRKMYIEAALYFFVIALISIGLSFVFSTFGIMSDSKILGDIFRLLVGAFGNALYRNKALRAFRKIKNMIEPERIISLEAMGGVSKLGVIVCIIFEIALAVFSVLIG